ncbi:MAG: hypothetical protein AAB268_00665 [Elusimicrobiota bacterium]
MARRSQAKDEARRVQIAFYKWEYLRRNDGYRQHYDELMDRYGKVLKRAGYPHSDYTKSLNEELLGRLGNLHFIWRVNFMKDPDMTLPLDALLRQGDKAWARNPFWNEYGFSILADTEVISPDVIRFKNLSVDFRLDKDWFPLAINLEAEPKTLEQPLMRLLKQVRLARKVQASGARRRLGIQKIEPGKDFAGFKDYILVWEAMRDLGIRGYIQPDGTWKRLLGKSKPPRFKTWGALAGHFLQGKWPAKHKPAPEEFLTRDEAVMLATKVGWLSGADASFQKMDRDVLRRARRATSQAVLLIDKKGYQNIS